MGIRTQIALTRGSLLVDADFAVADGQTLAVLGPNGAGKSTLLQAIAGLLEPHWGEVSVNGRLLTRVGPGQPRVLVPARQRSIGLLGQDPLLFPHLSALENVAFGARAQGTDAAGARRRARGWLDAVGLAGFEARRPAALSGGQQQRVAIARALAAEPDVLLLDEPLAALDVETASLVRTLLRERLRRAAVTTVLVTHDVVDAIMLADTVAILEAGRIVDIGPTARVLAEPVNRFAATLVGVNLVTGTVTDRGRVRCADGREFAAGPAPAGPAAAGPGAAGPGATVPGPAGAAVSATFPPSAVRVQPAAGQQPGQQHGQQHGQQPGQQPGPNSWCATVTALEPDAGGIRLVLDDGATIARMPPAAVLAAGLVQGSPVSVWVDPAAVTVYRSRY